MSLMAVSEALHRLLASASAEPLPETETLKFTGCLFALAGL